MNATHTRGTARHSSAASLAPRAVQLHQLKTRSFAAVTAAPQGSVSGLYAITSDGDLVLLKPNGRGVDKKVNLQVCGCSTGHGW